MKSIGSHRVASERGAALISVLLLLIIVSALSAALSVSSRTELLVARNRELGAQARAAAEAGLNHAAEVTISNLGQWQANGFVNAGAAITRLLRGPDDQTGTAARDADNGSLENLGIPRPPTRLGLAGLPNVGYEARVFDEDDPGRGLTLSAADRTSIGEDGSATVDANTRILARAIGYASDGTQVTLEATIRPLGLPAILTDGDLRISGNPSILGVAGSVHTNEDLTISGNPTIAQNATASGTYSTSGNPTIGGTASGSLPVIPVPPVQALDYRPQADYILTSTGRLTNQAGTVLCDASQNNNACRAGYGWTFNGGNGWTISQDSATGATYFLETAATISGNPGSNVNPLQITIIAQGSIDVSGNPDLRPDTPGLLFVTDGDLKIGGNMEMAAGVEGQMLVREQLSISGNPVLFGNIVVDNAASVSNLVTDNRISGNPTITSNGLSGGLTFEIGAWREVR